MVEEVAEIENKEQSCQNQGWDKSSLSRGHDALVVVYRENAELPKINCYASNKLFNEVWLCPIDAPPSNLKLWKGKKIEKPNLW